MRQKKSASIIRRGLACLLAVVLLCLCLGACSDEVLETGTGGLVIIDGTGTHHAGGTGVLGLVTEPTTGGSLSIQPTGDPYANAAHVLRMDVLNVGDADAILVRADDTVILVDTGESNDYHKLASTLEKYEITTIDYLIISHYDNDHIGSASRILQNYTVTEVYMPDYIRDSSLYRKTVGTLEVLEADGKTTVHRPHGDENIDIALANGRLRINPTKLYAPGLTLGSDASHDLQENDYSLITSITFGEVNILLAGDAEGARIAEYAAALPADAPGFDIIKIPHHGGYDKELGDFLRAEKAKGQLRYCAVSVGDQSLVEAQLVTAMRTTGAGVYYTYDGDICFATDGITMTKVTG